MAGGVAAALAAGRGDMGLFEVDEFWLGPVARDLAPRAVLLGNLFRDQLDRYGELEIIADRWAEIADGLPAATGLVLDPYFSAPKMRWIRDNLTRDGVVTTTDTWIVHHLCGAFVTDASTASRSLLYALDTGGWDDSLVGLFGLGDEELPEIVASDDTATSRAASPGTSAMQICQLKPSGANRPVMACPMRPAKL